MLFALVAFIPLLQSHYPEYSFTDSQLILIFQLLLGVSILSMVVLIYLRKHAIGHYIAGVDTFSDMEDYLY